jgi:hypothetical protein
MAMLMVWRRGCRRPAPAVRLPLHPPLPARHKRRPASDAGRCRRSACSKTAAARHRPVCRRSGSARVFPRTWPKYGSCAPARQPAGALAAQKQARQERPPKLAAAALRRAVWDSCQSTIRPKMKIEGGAQRLIQTEDLMRKLAMMLTATTFVIGSTAITATAQTQALGAKNLHVRSQNATLFKDTACRGWGAHCAPGRVWRCGPYGRCGCALC